jgi:two-component system sensor histidine kinase PilS (NtrC family)
VQTANQAAARILSAAVDDLVGGPLPPLLAPVLAGKERVVELIEEQEGATLHLAVIRAPLDPGDDENVQREARQVLVIEDRTELHHLHDSLRARERLASLGQMAAGIAHELRNPLAAISGSVELMHSEAEAGEVRERLEAIVLREIERLNALVDDFLVYARPVAPVHNPTDLAALVRDIAAVFRQDAAFVGHAIEVKAPPELVAAVDAGQVRQMMWNLLRNAAEASPADLPIELAVSSDGARAQIVVRDRGCGVAPEIRQQLFEPFQTTKESGTGLGLAIVHNIVSAHGGSVALHPRAGGGTDTCVDLPLL